MHQDHTNNRSGHSHQLPSFLITIDTEGDNLWARPQTITTRNAAFLPRFQKLCETYGFKPTYLTNYEMAVLPEFQEFGKDIIARATGEIGMHLHAWNSPPLSPLTSDDYHFRPYLVEFPPQAIRDKVNFMTDLLENEFGVKMLSHRAGRYAFNGVYARALAVCGYLVDCSVTPGVSWRKDKGDPAGEGGTDYMNYSSEEYFLDLNDISLPGNSVLLELPITIFPSRLAGVNRVANRLLPPSSFPWRMVNHFCPQTRWFRPTRYNRSYLLRLMRRVLAEQRHYIEFTMHSSELMPEGSPVFPTEKDIEGLYETLHEVFETACRSFCGRTLAEHYQKAVRSRMNAKP